MAPQKRCKRKCRAKKIYKRLPNTTWKLSYPHSAKILPKMELRVWKIEAFFILPPHRVPLWGKMGWVHELLMCRSCGDPVRKKEVNTHQCDWWEIMMTTSKAHRWWRWWWWWHRLSLADGDGSGSPITKQPQPFSGLLNNLSSFQSYQTTCPFQGYQTLPKEYPRKAYRLIVNT